MRLLVIIVTYNGMKWLDKCLSSVEKSSVKGDLFIVDNGSTDGSKDFIKNHYPEATFIESKENLGFGKANNLGLKFALDQNYDYVYLLNQDAWVETDTFEKLISVSKDNPDYGILSPLQTNRQKTRLDSTFFEYSPINLFSDLILNQDVKSIYSVNFIMAAHWLLPISVIEKVGGFSPTFTHYGEDNNYAHRTMYWGFKLGIVPLSIGVHDRENRGLPISKKMHLTEMTWKYYLSNPLNSSKIRKKQILKSCFLSFVKYPRISIKHIFRLLTEYNKIRKNFKLSTSTTRAFL